MNIEIRIEEERGCGFRQPGGTYLVADGLSAICGRLPVPLDVCPTCRAGIKPTRGWTWIDVAKLVGPLTRSDECSADHCSQCPVNGVVEKAGLLWVGERFYPAPSAFTREAARLGVSRRISAVPNDFILGETWVLFAHRKAIKTFCQSSERHPEDCECEGTGVLFQPAIFHAFRPTRIEYVVTGKEAPADLERLTERGITLVKVVPNRAPLFNLPTE